MDDGRWMRWIRFSWTKFKKWSVKINKSVCECVSVRGGEREKNGQVLQSQPESGRSSMFQPRYDPVFLTHPVNLSHPAFYTVTPNVLKLGSLGFSMASHTCFTSQWTNRIRDTWTERSRLQWQQRSRTHFLSSWKELPPLNLGCTGSSMDFPLLWDFWAAKRGEGKRGEEVLDKCCNHQERKGWGWEEAGGGGWWETSTRLLTRTVTGKR